MARTGEVFVCSERHEIRSVSPICPELGVGFVEDGWSAAAAKGHVFRVALRPAMSPSAWPRTGCAG